MRATRRYTQTGAQILYRAAVDFISLSASINFSPAYNHFALVSFLCAHVRTLCGFPHRTPPGSVEQNGTLNRHTDTTRKSSRSGMKLTGYINRQYAQKAQQQQQQQQPLKPQQLDSQTNNKSDNNEFGSELQQWNVSAYSVYLAEDNTRKSISCSVFTASAYLFDFGWNHTPAYVQLYTKYYEPEPQINQREALRLISHRTDMPKMDCSSIRGGFCCCLCCLRRDRARI